MNLLVILRQAQNDRIQIFLITFNQIFFRIYFKINNLFIDL